MPVNYKNWINENADAKKEIDESKSTQKNSVKKSFGKVANKISKTVANVKNKFSDLEVERERKNFEKMNELRYNSAHFNCVDFWIWRNFIFYSGTTGNDVYSD